MNFQLSLLPSSVDPTVRANKQTITTTPPALVHYHHYSPTIKHLDHQRWFTSTRPLSHRSWPTGSGLALTKCSWALWQCTELTWVKETLESFFNTLEPLYLSNAVIQTIHSWSNDKCTDMQCSQVLGRWWKLVGCIFGMFCHVSPQPTNNKYLKTPPRLLSFLQFLTHRLVDFSSKFRQNSFRNKFHGKARNPNGISNLRFALWQTDKPPLCVFRTHGPT